MTVRGNNGNNQGAQESALAQGLVHRIFPLLYIILCLAAISLGVAYILGNLIGWAANSFAHGLGSSLHHY